ncbi:hypothetical protein GCM10022234_13300 [Aeromicrobium panaciterrae]|uniref:hypothetical protein n=1 Tax=Aeromicrobium panaciterrae TaxID=363861 RepID=UPI0031DB493D
MPRVRLTAAAALLAFLAACGGSDSGGPHDTKGDEPAKLVEPRSGQCIGTEVPDGDDLAPDMTSVVQCSELHSYEIVAVVDIPADMLSGTTDTEKLARRTELATISGEDTELRKRLRTEVYSLCDGPFREATGLGQATVVKKSATEVGLKLPPGPVSQWYNLSPPKLWLKGTAQAICSFRFAPETEDDVVSKVTPIRSNTTNPAMSSYLSRKLPAGLRSCWDNTADKAVPCDGPHDQELMWIIDMKAVYGKDYLKGANLEDVKDADFTKLADACVEPYNQTGGHLAGRIGMGFRFFSGIPTTGTTLPIICVISSTEHKKLEVPTAYTTRF